MKRYFLIALLTSALTYPLNRDDLFKLFLEDIPFNCEHIPASTVRGRIQDFIQKIEDPFGIHSLPFHSQGCLQYTMKATVLDLALLDKITLSMMDTTMWSSSMLTFFNQRNQMLVEELSNAGFKQTLSDATLELLARARSEYIVEDDPSKLRLVKPILRLLKTMGIITSGPVSGTFNKGK